MLLTVLLACAPTDPTDPTDPLATDDTREDPAVDDTGPTDTGTTGSTIPLTWDAVWPILDAKCGECHTSPYIGEFLAEDDPDASYRLLLGGVSHTQGERAYVVPHEPDASLIVEKLGDAPAVGEPMPPEGEEPLTAAEIEALRGWITWGALR